MSEILLETRDICCGYPTLPEVVKSVSLSLRKGEFTGLIGPNGEGKTTLFRALSGYLKLTQGKILLAGDDIYQLSPRNRAQQLAVVPQDVFTPLPYSVREVVEMGRLSRVSRWTPLRPADHDLVDQVLEKMEVVKLAGRSFGQLSGGEKQRVMIAMALAQEPNLLLLDEPTSHLDLGHKAHLMKLLGELNQQENLTILLISHDVQTAACHCRRLVLFNQGSIFAEGSPDEVLTDKNLSELYSCAVSVKKIQDEKHLWIFPE